MVSISVGQYYTQGRVYRVGVWFGFVRFTLLLEVVLCWVGRCFDSWVLPCLFCLLRVTGWEAISISMMWP